MTYSEVNAFCCSNATMAIRDMECALGGTGPIGNDVLQQAGTPSSPSYSQNCGGCGYTKLKYCRVNGEWEIFDIITAGGPLRWDGGS